MATAKTYTVRIVPCIDSTKTFTYVQVSDEFLPWTHGTRKAATAHIKELKSSGYVQLQGMEEGS